MILTYSIVALCTCLYLFILFVGIFATINNKTVKIARVLSLPVVIIFIFVLAMIAAGMMAYKFVQQGKKAFKL